LDINVLHEKARSGDVEDVNRLFGFLTVRFRYLATLRLGNEADAEEVAQEALMVISKEYKEVVIESSFAAWALKVLENRILNFLRSKTIRQRKLEQRVETGDIPDGHHSNPGPDLKGRLLDCLRKLCEWNPRYARILNLHYQGFTTDEICDKMKITPGNFYVILSRARSQLQACLDDRSVK
jgi:RNA polymerase sigma factor (sigma-70 family)